MAFTTEAPYYASRTSPAGRAAPWWHGPPVLLPCAVFGGRACLHHHPLPVAIFSSRYRHFAQAMALPRWVCAAHVDSGAMLMAAAQFRHENPHAWRDMQVEGHITKVVHCGVPAGSQRVDETDTWCRIIKCPHSTDGRCARCKKARAGYTFRWLSPYWAAAYERNRRPRSWGLGDSEALPGFGENFTGNSMNCFGRLPPVQNGPLGLRAAALALLFLVKLRRHLWKRHMYEASHGIDGLDVLGRNQKMCWLRDRAPPGLLPSSDSDDSDGLA